MAQLAVPGPFGECHFRHEGRLDPGHLPLTDLVAVGERRTGLLQPSQLPAQATKCLNVVASPHFTGVPQSALLVVADKQGTEPDAAALQERLNNVSADFGCSVDLLGTGSLSPRWRSSAARHRAS
jgi:hypothetical protein